MREPPGAAEGAAAPSAWPVVVAAGLVVSELGVFVGSVPVAVGGLLLFGGGASGLVHEAGYVASPASGLVLFGGLFAVLGGGLWAYGVSVATASALVAAPGVDGLARRGLAILVAGGLLLGAGVVTRAASSAGR